MAKLVEHIINGGGSVTIGLGIPFIVKPLIILDNDDDPIPAGYRDISTIYYWHNFGHGLNRDYIYVRNEIKKLAESFAETACYGIYDDPELVPSEAIAVCVGGNPVGDFVGFNGKVAIKEGEGWIFRDKSQYYYRISDLDTKKILNYYGFGNISDRTSDLGIDVIRDANVAYHKAAIAARKERMYYLSIIVWNELPQFANIILGIAASPAYGNMYWLYQEFGVKGSEEDYDIERNANPSDGIVDYILGRSSWTGNGIVDMPWEPTSSGYTMEEVTNDMYEVLVNGIYPKVN